MRNIDEHQITPAVLERLSGCRDPRLREVLGALVRHLHDFAREVRLTEAEWAEGIAFLTDTGHWCDAKRQEFILLSDVLGLSMLTVAMNQARPAGATEATVFGPFHVEGVAPSADGSDIAGDAPGEPLYVQLSVVGLDGRPVAGATVDVWQADADGRYDVQVDGLDGHRARGVFTSDAEGRVRLRSILPTAYPVPTDGPVGRLLEASGRHPWRPAHVHLRVQAPGWQTLITHLFRDGDPYLDSDVVFGVRQSLVVHFVRVPGGRTPDGQSSAQPFHVLHHRVVLVPETPDSP